MTHKNVMPAYVGLLQDGLVIVLWILTWINFTIIEPVRDCATERIQETCVRFDKCKLSSYGSNISAT